MAYDLHIFHKQQNYKQIHLLNNYLHKHLSTDSLFWNYHIIHNTYYQYIQYSLTLLINIFCNMFDLSNYYCLNLNLPLYYIHSIHTLIYNLFNLNLQRDCYRTTHRYLLKLDIFNKHLYHILSNEYQKRYSYRKDNQ